MCKMLRRSSQGNPSDPGKTQPLKYSDAGHVEGYISEMVQDTASGTIND